MDCGVAGFSVIYGQVVIFEQGGEHAVTSTGELGVFVVSQDEIMPPQS